MAHIDYLTGLPNRKSFEDFMEIKIKEANRKKTKIAVFFFDLNDFKQINDTYGHNFGDKVLQAMASRFKNNMNKEGIICRLGGDEFIGAIPGLEENEDIIKCSNKILRMFSEKFKIDSEYLSINSALGISIYPDHGDHVEELIFKADSAMYIAKQNKLDYLMYSRDLADSQGPPLPSNPYS